MILLTFLLGGVTALLLFIVGLAVYNLEIIGNAVIVYCTVGFLGGIIALFVGYWAEMLLAWLMTTSSAIRKRGKRS